MRHPSANASQQSRRVRNRRMDYYPSREAEAVIEAVRAPLRPGSASATNGAILDAIVTAWAESSGIKYQSEIKPKTSGVGSEFIDATRARMSSGLQRATPMQRATCGAKRHRDGQPCEAKSEPGKKRCRFHGGRSTGPRTPEGKARALANLRRGSSHHSLATNSGEDKPMGPSHR